MVVISIGVLNKSGRVLLARQFIPITKQRIESLYNSFPKLLSTDVQHTFIETEQVRYVYQLVDELYSVLITTKNSNIMEDLDTLRIVCKLIPEYCGSSIESDVTYNAYELCHALDELVSIGYREPVTVSQIRTFTEMDSHEEKLQKIIQESKINEAREQMKQRADNIERKKQEDRKLNAEMNSGMSYSSRTAKKAFGSVSQYNNDYNDNSSKSPYNNDVTESHSPIVSSRPATVKQGAAVKGKGMSLSKSKKTTDEFLSSVAREDSTISSVPVQLGHTDADTAQHTNTNNNAATALVQGQDGVNVIIEEVVVVELERDMTLKKMELKGEMKLQIYDPQYANIVVLTNNQLSDNDAFKCRLHPKINKQLWSDSQSLALSDSTKSFPVGSDNALAVCKWRKQYIDDTSVPIAFNIWPTNENNQSVVSCEYTMEHDELTLDSVQVSIPCPTQPTVSTCTGNWKYDKNNKLLLWQIGRIDGDTSQGQIEFAVSETDTDTFYPIHVSFHSTQAFSGVNITSIQTVNDQTDVKFVPHISFTAESYVID